MKVSDYIVKIMKAAGCTDVFGYQGGMIAHFADSLASDSSIKVHTLLNEQSCAFAACGYAQLSGKIGWVYTSSGPGATNLITGICNAFYDSIPVIFITGQVNTNEAKGTLKVRQKAFQETDIISMVKPVTKACYYIGRVEDVPKLFLDAINTARSGRMGPVLLDLPMDIQRKNIDIPIPDRIVLENRTFPVVDDNMLKNIASCLKQASRPVFILGNGIKCSKNEEMAKKLVENSGIPCVTSMISCDIFDYPCELNYGFLGAYGDRTANFIVAKSDLIISLGSRLDVRQIGGKKENFAPNAKLIRVDIDESELENRIKNDEIHIQSNLTDVILGLLTVTQNCDYSNWVKVCNRIKSKLQGYDSTEANRIISSISECVPPNVSITTDVGQNQVWVAQSFKFKHGQRMLFSGGHGAMGYALPAAVGTYFATKKPVVCFCGDGGLQMNIQELQIIKEYNLPILIVVLNNASLGMIRHFQEMYFEGRYVQTTKESGYSTPDFTKIAKAYGIEAYEYKSCEDVQEWVESPHPVLLDVKLSTKTYIWPKLEFGKPNQDQEPLINRDLYEELMQL